MLKEQYYQLSESIVEQAKNRYAGNLLANHLRQQPTFLLDMDGVVVQGDSLQCPTVTTPYMIPTLQLLEAQGVAIGPATGRGKHVVDFLRKQGLELSGPAILEEGHVVQINGETTYLGNHKHRSFMKTMNAEMTRHPDFVPSWDKARAARNEGKFAFCPGNFQWQGECRSSFWFSYNEEQEDRDFVHDRFVPAIQTIASKHGLDYDRNIAIGVSRMKPKAVNGNLAIVSIKGKQNGRTIDKGIAAKELVGSWSFAADGFGDTPLAEVTIGNGGVVIGIEGNLDMTKDAAIFLRSADAVVKDPNEFVRMLRHTANALRFRST